MERSNGVKRNGVKKRGNENGGEQSKRSRAPVAVADGEDGGVAVAPRKSATRGKPKESVVDGGRPKRTRKVVDNGDDEDDNEDVPKKGRRTRDLPPPPPPPPPVKARALKNGDVSRGPGNELVF